MTESRWQFPGPLSEVIAIDQIDAPRCTDGHVLIAANYAGVQYPNALERKACINKSRTCPMCLAWM